MTTSHTSGAGRVAVTVAVVLAVAGAVLVATTPTASGRQVESPTRDVDQLRVTYVERYAPRRYWVETNDGAAYRLRACRWEDSRRCVWDARRHGNGAGRSFAVIRGKLVTIRPRMMRRAY